jgi:glycine/D-amino acid oxidase-like deaminating enzyme
MPEVFGVIGGGVAGTLTTLRLAIKGFTVYWWDDFSDDTASLKAAGLFNVFTGRNPTLTWHARELRQSFHRFLDSDTGKCFLPFVQFKRLYRPFNSKEHRNEWLEKINQSAYDTILTWQDTSIEQAENPFGGIWVEEVGWLDVPAFLKESRLLIQNNFPKVYRTNDFFHSKRVNLEEHNFIYGNKIIGYDHVIFCEGMDADTNPLWRPYIFIQELKGQLLRLKADIDLPYIIVNQHGFMIPVGKGIWTVGSTYEHTYDHVHPTEEARDLLCKAFETSFSVPVKYEVTDHWTGIRPTTPDHKPIIGRHPLYANLWILNGLGTKGVLLSCYGSEILINHILENQPLPHEVRPARWKKKKTDIR